MHKIYFEVYTLIYVYYFLLKVITYGTNVKNGLEPY